jgi:N-acetylglucosaminyl-diphospho-decaprenol L-rhamnosyltransferase
VEADAVIVTWRSGARVLECLERLALQHPAERTFVVDNASNDGTVDGVRATFPGVRVLELERNRGFGGAVNAGVRSGRSEALVLVNDDVLLAPDAVERLLEPLGADPRCGMVAGLTLLPHTELVDGFGIELDVTLAAYNRLRGRRPDGSPGRLAMPSGGLAAYRRVAFEQVKGFDERLLAYGEDVDLGLRLRLAGWTASAAPAARGVHEGGASIGRGSRQQRMLAGIARGFLLRRYGILRGRHAPRTLLVECMVVAWGLIAHRTLVPLRARARGWRLAGRERLPVPEDSLDRSIGLREAMRRLSSAQ